MTNTIKKTTLGELTDLYDSLSQSMGSFAGTIGYQERIRELQRVHRSRATLVEALSHGVRRSATSVRMVEMAMHLISDADDLEVNLEDEAARSIRLMAKLETSGACIDRQEEAARDHRVLLAAIAKSDIATKDHAKAVANVLGIETPHTAQVYSFETRRRIA